MDEVAVGDAPEPMPDLVFPVLLRVAMRKLFEASEKRSGCGVSCVGGEKSRDVGEEEFGACYVLSIMLKGDNWNAGKEDGCGVCSYSCS
jgi:hypothetical protein